ncbi:MAG: M48 family metallopeptidase [Pseudomonadota bacterium]
MPHPLPARLLLALCLLLAAGFAPISGALAQEATAPAFDVEQASRAYIDTLQGEALEKSNAYFEGGYWLILWGALVTMAIDFLLLGTRMTSRFRSWAERRTKRHWLVTWLTTLPYLLVSWVLTLPWTIYTGYIREKQYDLMSQSYGQWFSEQLIGLVISLIIFPLLVVAIFALVRRAPKSWWIWGTGVVASFAFIGLLLAPVFIAPMFNEYSDMAEGPLRDRIVAMAAEHDVPADNIYVFDQSTQNKRISANVSGVGPTIRISLNDNLLERTDPEEVAAVMGHELGHYVLGHTWRSIIILTLIMAVGLFFVARAGPWLIARFGQRWGVHDMADPAALPLYGILLSVFFLLATPALNTLIRVNESDADRFGLDTAKEPDGFAKVAMRLSEYRKIEPGPIEEFLFFDHPSGATRVRMAMQWKADNVDNPQMVVPEGLGAANDAPAPEQPE